MAIEGRPQRGGRITVRQAVLDGTAELLAERPFETLTVADIIKRSGVSRTGFYYHFASKAEVLLALVDDVADLLVAQLAHVSTPGAAVEAALGIWEQRRPLLLLAQRAARSESDLGERWRALIEERGVRPLGRHLRDEQTAGRLEPDVDPEALARALLGTSEQALFAHAAGYAEAAPSTMLAALTHVWAAALAPPAR
ncbi:MAG TPA: helix-turn-helix domain-containing protein [Conexibacter sp.]|jgi:AcrR family transcriptional regulator